MINEFDDQAENQIVISLSKKKLLLCFIGSVVFVVLGLWLIIVHPTRNLHPIFMHPSVIIAIGCVTILFFGICAVYLFFALFDNKPGLIISTTGLNDNSSGVAAGIILWSDINNMSVYEIAGQKFVLLFVHNPEEFINRQKSAFRRFLMRRNLNMCGTPLSISSVGLKITFNELLEILNEYYAKSKL